MSLEREFEMLANSSVAAVPGRKGTLPFCGIFRELSISIEPVCPGGRVALIDLCRLTLRPR